MVNPIKYYRHALGPRRKIVRTLWLGSRQRVLVLECGHAVQNKRISRRNYDCPACNKRLRFDPLEVKKRGAIPGVLVQSAVLEGIRRVALLYFKERKEPIPPQLQHKFCHFALYDRIDRVIYCRKETFAFAAGLEQ